MKKFIMFFAVKILLFIVLMFALNSGLILKAQAISEDKQVTLSTTVSSAFLDLAISAGGNVAFGNLTPGIPIPAPAGGTVATVTTDATNGYTIGVSDGVSGNDSCLLHTDTTTRIADYDGTIGTPTLWLDGTSKGLGITLFAADHNKEAKWGSGAAYNDGNNQYAGVPETATTAHTVTGVLANPDDSNWAFKLDVVGSQKSGNYQGDITFTATTVML